MVNQHALQALWSASNLQTGDSQASSRTTSQIFNKPAREFINYPVDERTHESSLVHNLTHKAVHDTQENIV